MIEPLRAMIGKKLVGAEPHMDAIETGVMLTFEGEGGAVESVILAAQSSPDFVVSEMLPGADCRPRTAEGEGIG